MSTKNCLKPAAFGNEVPDRIESVQAGCHEFTARILNQAGENAIALYQFNDYGRSA